MLRWSRINLVLGVGGGVNTFIYHENGFETLNKREMSTFTNYETKAASDYHLVRIPVGIEVGSFLFFHWAHENHIFEKMTVGLIRFVF